MPLSLIPQPKKIRVREGEWTIPSNARIGISDPALFDTATEARILFRSGEIHASAPGIADDVCLRVDTELGREEYRLAIGRQGVTIAGGDDAAVFYGLQTLEQILEQHPRRLPHLSIHDRPDFEDRGVYYDVCRGRVPTLEQLLALADVLAHYKINHLQLYIEHTFAFRGHPNIGKGASPLSAEDILLLDGYCRPLHIELVPSLASFGHLSPVLKLEEYRHLAEDWGVGKYVAPENEALGSQLPRAWTLSPANPGIYDFLDSLFAEFLPLFSSGRFNICCDETWDLGLGQSYELCKKKGKGVVYLGHIRKVRDLCRKYGKKVMFWGDIIRHYPELIARIPKDVTVLDWGYSAHQDFDRIKDFKAAGLPFYACPGTSGWVSLFPRLPESAANIAGFAAAGKKHGAKGLLNTDWGDGGHYNFMEFSHWGYLFGAEQGWNTNADQSSFTDRFTRLFLGSDSKALSRAVARLGDVAQTGFGNYYQGIWQHVFFARPGDPVLANTEPRDASLAKNGQIEKKTIRLDAAFGRRTLEQIQPVQATLRAFARHKDCDPLEVLPYWVFAADTIAHAAKKLTVLGPGGTDTPSARRRLKKELTTLMDRFEALWMARNRRSEIRITLKRYRRAIAAL